MLDPFLSKKIKIEQSGITILILIFLGFCAYYCIVSGVGLAGVKGGGGRASLLRISFFFLSVTFSHLSPLQ